MRLGDDLAKVRYIRQIKSYTCALAVLQTALGHRRPNQPLPEIEELEVACNTTQIGTSSQAAYNAANLYGLNPQPLDTSALEDGVAQAIADGHLVIANLPLLALPYYNNAEPTQAHTVLLIGLEDNTVYLYDPDDPRFNLYSQTMLDTVVSRFNRMYRAVARKEFFEAWNRGIVPGNEFYKYSAYAV